MFNKTLSTNKQKESILLLAYTSCAACNEVVLDLNKGQIMCFNWIVTVLDSKWGFITECMWCRALQIGLQREGKKLCLAFYFFKSLDKQYKSCSLIIFL